MFIFDIQILKHVIMQLFDDKPRTDSDLAKHIEEPFKYYDRSATEHAVFIRTTLNGWFGNYPSEHQKELKSAFEKKFEDCFYELFVHELFYQHGCDITIHPEVPCTTKRPDFLIRKGIVEFYAEAKNIRLSTEEAKAAKRYAQFYDGLNILARHPFLIWITDLNFKTVNQPSVKPLLDFLKIDMEKYNPVDVAEKMNASADYEKPAFLFETDDFKIEGTYFPSNLLPEGDHHFIASYPPFDFLGDGHEEVTAALKKKIDRYGKPDKPYLICVNIMEVLAAGQLSAESVFWGSPKFSFHPRNPASSVRLERETNGVFWDSQRPRRTHVSAILLNRVSTSNFLESDYWMAKHPFAIKELDLDAFTFGYSYLKDNIGENRLGSSINEILNRKEVETSTVS